MQQDFSFSPNRCISVADALSLVGLSKSTVYALLAKEDSDFPKPLKIGRRTYFLANEIDAWISNRPRFKARSQAASCA